MELIMDVTLTRRIASRMFFILVLLPSCIGFPFVSVKRNENREPTTVIVANVKYGIEGQSEIYETKLK
jgi:hypothetical protein